MPIFEMPLLETYIEDTRPVQKHDYISIDGIGIYIGFNEGDDLSPEKIRRCLIGEKETFCRIKAENIETVINEFYTEWKGAYTGEKQKALVIDIKRPILEYPDCPRQTSSEKGNFLCDEEVSEEDSPSGCILSNCYPPDDCPIRQFLDDIHNKEQILEHPVIVEPYGEFLVVSPCRPALAIVSMK